MILSLDEMMALKAALKEACGVALHVHDACGGQSFTLERADEDVRAALVAYLAARGQKPVFARGGADFTITEETSC